MSDVRKRLYGVFVIWNVRDLVYPQYGTVLRWKRYDLTGEYFDDRR